VNDERKVISTNIRFNLAKPEDREAWEHLQRLDRSKYKSYTRAVVTALNSYFGRQEAVAADPYLETREKEDAFLERVIEAAQQGFQTAAPSLLFGSLVNLAQSGNLPTAPDQRSSMDEEPDELVDDALDFADSF
jgi:hypothetical protein